MWFGERSGRLTWQPTFPWLSSRGEKWSRGKACHVRSAPFRPPSVTTGPFAGCPIGQCPKDSHLAKQGLPREGGHWLQLWGEWLLWTWKDYMEIGGAPPTITWPPRSPCGQAGCVLLAQCPNAFLAHADTLYRFCLRNESGQWLSHSINWRA